MMKTVLRALCSSLFLAHACVRSASGDQGDLNKALEGFPISNRSLDVNLSPRQGGGLMCPAPDATFCNVGYCCPPQTICQPNNPTHAQACCPITALQCNGGTACCDATIGECCLTNRFGCCVRSGASSTIPQPFPSTPTPQPPFSNNAAKERAKSVIAILVLVVVIAIIEPLMISEFL